MNLMIFGQFALKLNIPLQQAPMVGVAGFEPSPGLSAHDLTHPMIIVTFSRMDFGLFKLVFRVRHHKHSSHLDNHPQVLKADGI